MNTENHATNGVPLALTSTIDLFATKRTRSKRAAKMQGRTGWWHQPGKKATAYWWSEKLERWNLVQPNPRKDKATRLMRTPHVSPASSHIGWEAGIKSPILPGESSGDPEFEHGNGD